MYSGVAARALHLSRGVEKPSGRVTYIVVLEGLCRFSVQELNARGSYHVARVSRLDMTKTGTALKVYIIFHTISFDSNHHKLVTAVISHSCTFFLNLASALMIFMVC
jgi:hypothetical protein